MQKKTTFIILIAAIVVVIGVMLFFMYGSKIYPPLSQETIDSYNPFIKASEKDNIRVTSNVDDAVNAFLKESNEDASRLITESSDSTLINSDSKELNDLNKDYSNEL